MSEPHLQRFELERLNVDDLDGDARARADLHLASCSTCASALASLRQERDAFFQVRPAEPFMMKLAARKARRRRTRARWLTGVSSALAAAAALLLWLRPGDELRLKGAGLNVYRNRAGRVALMREEDRIRAGDALEIAFARTRGGDAAAWAIDATGRVDAITAGVVSISAGDTPLATSAVVETPCRDLWLIVATRAPYLSATDTELKALLEKADRPDGLLTRHLFCE